MHLHRTNDSLVENLRLVNRRVADKDPLKGIPDRCQLLAQSYTATSYTKTPAIPGGTFAQTSMR